MSPVCCVVRSMLMSRRERRSEHYRCVARSVFLPCRRALNWLNIMVVLGLIMRTLQLSVNYLLSN